MQNCTFFVKLSALTNMLNRNSNGLVSKTGSLKSLFEWLAQRTSNGHN